VPRSPIFNSATIHEQHARRILDAVEANAQVSQRTLASDLGIALGLTNLLVRRLVRKGLLHAIHVQPNRVRYLITPAGIAERARLARSYFDLSLSFYRQTRSRIQERFTTLAVQHARIYPQAAAARIVFFGAGEVAEIGYVCLAETSLQLVGVIDSRREKAFFGIPVRGPVALTGLEVAGQPFDWLVLMSFEDFEPRSSELTASCVPPDRIFTL